MNAMGCNQSIYEEQLRKQTKNWSLLYFTQGFDTFLCSLSSNIKLKKLLKTAVHAECSLHVTFSLVSESDCAVTANSKA